MSKKISIPYFPAGLKYITPLIFGASIYLFAFRHWPWSILLVLLGLVILFSKYVTEINLEKKICRDYLSILGIPLQNEETAFKTLDRIIITKGIYSQTINTRIQSRQMDWTDYTATLLMDNDATLNLLTRNDKMELIKELKTFSDFLKVDVEDRSTREFYWVDMRKV